MAYAGVSQTETALWLNKMAVRPGVRVLVVEGEKATCAAMLIVEDYVVVTWPGGSTAARHADWTPLKGRDVTLWRDNDEPGRKA
jgi:putative DNA primase/helicase